MELHDYNHSLLCENLSHGRFILRVITESPGVQIPEILFTNLVTN